MHLGAANGEGTQRQCSTEGIKELRCVICICQLPVKNAIMYCKPVHHGKGDLRSCSGQWVTTSRLSITNFPEYSQVKARFFFSYLETGFAFTVQAGVRLAL